MGQIEREGTWRTVAKVAIAVAVGFLVLVLLFPASGVDTLPSRPVLAPPAPHRPDS